MEDYNNIRGMKNYFRTKQYYREYKLFWFEYPTHTGTMKKQYYIVYKDGTITTHYNKPLKRIIRKEKGGFMVYVAVHGVPLSYARIVYKAWNPEFDLNGKTVIRFKNGNRFDFRPCNLYETTRGEYLSKKKLTPEQEKAIVLLYNNTNTSHRLLAKAYGVSKFVIFDILRKSKNS